jgi:hypothetical protein
MTPHPNMALAVATLLTIGLGILYHTAQSAGPDRASMWLGCFLVQTPRWIGLALVLGLCVARGAFNWPAERGAQYAVVFLVHIVLGLGAIFASFGGLGVTPGVPGWLSRLLALSTLIVPAMQICFAAWFLNQGLHKNLEPTALRHTTNSALAAFAGIVCFFGIAGAVAWQLGVKEDMKSRAAYEAEKNARQNAEREVADKHLAF